MKLKNISTAFILLLLSLHLSAADLRVNIIDVGQGDSILIQTPNDKNILIDAGDTFAEKQIIDFLQSKNINQIDLMVLTHPDQDHGGNMLKVITTYPPAIFWYNSFYNKTAKWYQPLKSKITTLKNKKDVKAGDTDLIDEGVTLEVLGPVSPGKSSNNNSIVLRLTYNKNSFLLMGDCETEERDTITTFTHSDVLKVAHHGSINGTDTTFINKINPTYAAISYGLTGLNSDIDKTATLNTLKSNNVIVAETPKNGNITYSSDGTTITVNDTSIQNIDLKIKTGANDYPTKNATICVTPSRSASFIIILKNTGNTPDRFNIKISGNKSNCNQSFYNTDGKNILKLASGTGYLTPLIPSGKTLTYQFGISPASNSKIGDSSAAVISVNSENDVNITDSVKATAVRVK